jgi:cation diffusion facilitator family transporter
MTESRKNQVMRVTVAGMIINTLLCVFKIAAGIIGQSQAVVADGVHSISDTATDVALLVGAGFWFEPPDRSHPYGHGRVETLVTLALALILAGVAGGLVYTALVSLRQQHAEPPQWIALIAALTSLAVKEALYQWTVRVGRRVKSSAMVANAWHHRSDALSSIPAALAVTVGKLVPGWGFVDHIGSVVVCLFIFQVAWQIGSKAIQQLIDHGAPIRSIREMEAIVTDIEGVTEVHAMRTRHLGNGWSVDLHMLVNGDLTVRAGHELAELAKQRLLADGPDVCDVVVHVEPAELSRHRRNAT